MKKMVLSICAISGLFCASLISGCATVPQEQLDAKEAAIQSLNSQVDSLKQEIKKLQESNDELARTKSGLEEKLTDLEKKEQDLENKLLENKLKEKPQHKHIRRSGSHKQHQQEEEKTK